MNKNEYYSFGVYSYQEILLSNKKEQPTNTHNTDESPKQNAKWKRLTQGYATWLHLYEVLEEDKLNKDEKNRNKGERADGEGQARTFWVMLTFYNMMSLYATGPFTYQKPKFIQWLIHRVFVPFRTLANGTHVKVFGDDLCRCP